MNTSNNIRFLTREQLDGITQLKIMKLNGMLMSVTDFSILLGAHVSNNHLKLKDNDLKNRTGYYYTSSSIASNYIYSVESDGQIIGLDPRLRTFAARPAIYLPSNFNKYELKANKMMEIEYGEYPQMAVSEDKNIKLEKLFAQNILKETGKIYTTDSNKWDDYNAEFEPMQHIEYNYYGKKYIRVISKSIVHGNKEEKLSNGLTLNMVENKPVWIGVDPITWYYDDIENLLLSKKGIFSGVRSVDSVNFMNNYFSKEIISTNEYLKNKEKQGNARVKK